MNVHKLSLDASKRINRYIVSTPLKRSSWLSDETGANVFLKCENFQHTGSFKFRGALNKLLSLSDEERSKGIITASTGNHGVAIARAMSILKTSGLIFTPSNVSEYKLERIKKYSVEIKQFGNDCVISEREARKFSSIKGMNYISPYNDTDVIAGQGTIGIELLEQCPHADSIFISLGGGGLISGVAGCIKEAGYNISMVACSPENSPIMHKSIEVGRIADFKSKPTLSDGTAGGVEEGSITFDFCQEFIDDYVLVSEEEIASSLIAFMENENFTIEGSAALAIAGFLRESNKWIGKKVVIILCGGNISRKQLKEIS